MVEEGDDNCEPAMVDVLSPLLSPAVSLSVMLHLNL